LPDENLTGVPKSMMQLESRMLYPTRRFLQNMFSSQSLVNKSWMLQVIQRYSHRVHCTHTVDS
jgi:hypothetical protein